MTKTKQTPSSYLAQIEKACDEAHAACIAARDQRDAFDRETQELMGEMTVRQSTHPHEFAGAGKRPKDGTQAAKLREAILKRQREPNPHEQKYGEVRATWLAMDEERQEWKRAHVRDRLAELNAEASAAKIRKGLELVQEGCTEHEADICRVRDIVIDTPGFTGQDYDHDRRPPEWLRLASDALDSEITPPGLTPLGEWKADQHA